jgi:phosphonoacetaldehyde hydrolase
VFDFVYQRRYCGGLKAILLDWAGTTLDFGCMAPAVVFVEVFKREGVPISTDEARAPMGAHKRVHIKKISQLPSVAARWQKAHGKPCSEADIDRMFAAFVPLQLDCLGDYADLVPGALETVEALRHRHLKIGSTTGYTREMMELLMELAEGRGYRPDASVCATDVPAGRPYPFMCLKNVIDLEVSPIQAVVKVDDTLPGIEEGLNAGMWTIGLAVSGNEVGLTLAEWEALRAEEQRFRRARAYRRMHRAGAHYVVDTLADILPCLDTIEARLAKGERP